MLKNIFKICFIFIWLVFVRWFSFWYQNEWFLEYQEWDYGIRFVCEKKCTIFLWQKEKTDYLNINWTIRWTGTLKILNKKWNEENVLISSILSLTWSASMIFNNYEKTLYEVSNNWYLWVDIDWDIKWNLKIDKVSLSFFQKFLRYSKEFWKMEPLYQMSMYSREWVLIAWNSILQYWYKIFALLLVWILIFPKITMKIKIRIIFYISLSLFLFVWIRNTVTYTYILDEWLSWFKKDQTYFDLEDFIQFVSEVRDTLNLDSKELTKDDCKIFMNINKYNRAVYHHGEFYFKPCERVYLSDKADFIIYYNEWIKFEDLGKEILVKHNWAYLLDNKSK